MLQFFDDLESGVLEKRCSDADLQEITEYIVHLSTVGTFPEDDHLAMHADIANLLSPSAFMYADPLKEDYRFSYCDASTSEYELCEVSFSKTWKSIKKHAKKHKKKLIIGGAIVLAAAVIAVAVVSVSAAGTAAAVAAAGVSSQSIDDEVRVVKDHLIEKETLKTPSETSVEDTMRTIGSLSAHERTKDLPIIAHAHVDQKFTTNYAPHFSPSNPQEDFQILSHQLRGEQALATGYNKQAIKDLSAAIDLSPTRAPPYLERSIAHLNQGNYERSLEDFQTFAQNTTPFSGIEFTQGFAKGLSKGVYDSGGQLLSFAGEMALHPIHTAKQMWDGLVTLAGLIKTKEGDAIFEALAPEVRQLTLEWDTLPLNKRGELAAYALGKHGGDIFFPGTVAKGGKHLTNLCKQLKNVEKVYALEVAAESGGAIKASQLLKNVKKAEEIGLSAKEVKHLQKAGKLEETLKATYKAVVENPALKQSIEKYNNARKFLKQYPGFMSESRAKELIHQAGVQTFPRPKGIPKDYKIKLSEKGAGIIYVDPKNTHNSVRVMPGKPHSYNPSQREPYVIQKREGRAYNKLGKFVDSAEPEAHIPIRQFTFQGN